jgi:hypothetical protein
VKKFTGCPKVYYFNNDLHSQLKTNMETGLESIGVSDYERISTSKYTKENVSDWRNFIVDAKNYKLPSSTASYAITVLEFLKKWYQDTEEETLIISRDTIDFGVVEHIRFDWQVMMSNLPYDWDSFLLGFENVNYIPFYLHPIMPGHTFNISMLNRRYVKKLIRLHCHEDKYKLTGKIANVNFGLKSGTVDYFLGHCGKTYCLPVFPNHTDFYGQNTKKYAIVKSSRLAYYDWWRSKSEKYSDKEIFTYGKPNDSGMVGRCKKWI